MWMSWWTGSPAASPSPADTGAEAGFTLLEVLVAFAILAVALTAVLQAFGGGLESVRRADAAALSLAKARSLLERVGAELAIAPGVLNGGEEGAGWSISISRRKSPLDQMKGLEMRYALYDVVVTVAEPGAAPVSLATVRLAPEP